MGLSSMEEMNRVANIIFSLAMAILFAVIAIVISVLIADKPIEYKAIRVAECVETMTRHGNPENTKIFEAAVRFCSDSIYKDE